MDVKQLSLKQAQKLMLKYRILWILDIFTLLLCIGCLSAGILIKTNAYNNAISISTATDTQEKQTAYLEAISLYPQRPEAYLCLLDSFEEDGLFTKEESDAFLSCYNGNHTKLNTNHDGYAQLHTNVGLMYVNGYSADSATRLRLALPFLEEARKYMTEEDPQYLTVECYCHIGSFYREYIWNSTAAVKEVDASQMAELVSGIENTLNALKAETSGDAIYNRLGFCYSVCNLFYDQRDILAATVDQKAVESVMEQIYSDLPESASLQREQTKILLASLLDNEAFYKDALDRAFGRLEAGT